MSLDEIIEGTDAHFHMTCSRCQYHREADGNGDEYCGRSELFQDVLRSLYTLKELKNAYKRFHGDSDWNL